MALRRCISASLSTSQKHAALPAVVPALAEFCQALFPLLVVHADDFGRLQGDAFTVKHQCWPTSPRSVEEFNAALSALHRVGMVQRYAVDGREYLCVVNFEPHQPGLNKRTRSKLPDPPELPGISRKLPDTPDVVGSVPVIPSEQNRTEQKGTERKSTPRARVTDHGFERFWAVYPKKDAKADALKTWRQVKPDEETLTLIIADVQARSCGEAWTKDDGQFIPLPATYLRKRRWTDEGVKVQQAERKVWCEHDPQCSHYQEHVRRLCERAANVQRENESATNGDDARLTVTQVG